MAGRKKEHVTEETRARIIEYFSMVDDNSIRSISNDLDIKHDTVKRVIDAYFRCKSDRNERTLGS